MKKLARLVLFFSLAFAVLFLASTGLRFLAIRVNWIRTLPREPETMLSELVMAARWALSLGIYGSLLLTLNYAAEKRIFAPLTTLSLLILSLGFSFGLSAALERMDNVPPARDIAKPLGEAGMILTRNDISIVLLRGPEEARGPRVVAIPGRPIFYQAEPVGPNNTVLSLPPIPFRDESPWFLKSIAIDINLSAGQLQSHYRQGLVPFLVYAGALIFFLGSLGFILKLSAWPLANLFVGCLAFRGILALEIFLNSPEIQDLFESFLGKRFPLSLTVPLIFCALGALVYLYSVLVYLAGRRSNEED
jgi:small-conductance mechanosensitive channel